MIQQNRGLKMQRDLVKIYRNRAVFFEKPNRIVVETIDDKALKILNYYEKQKNYNLSLDNL